MTDPGPPPSLPYGNRTLPIPTEPFLLESVVLDGGPLSQAGTGLDTAFDQAIGMPPLETVLRDARRVLVCVSDGTRETGSRDFLPPLLDRIRRAGSAEVRFVIAGGLHRRPDPGEIERQLGRSLVSEHEVLLHDAGDPELVFLGTTSRGTPVRVHPAATECDRLVLTGTVGFHYYAGFSGGRKSVVPGLAARETIASNHMRALRRDGTRHPQARAGRLDGNPVHRDMVEGAALAAPALVVNSVVDSAGGIERLYVGHWRRAHEAACRYVRSTRTLRVEPRPVVVVSAGGAPHDTDLIQAHKAFEAAFEALTPGGVLILAAECPGGAGHDDFLDGIRHRSESALARALAEEFRVYRQTALSWIHKARRCRLVLVSGLEGRLAGELGAWPAADLREALRFASRYHPRGTPGWVVPWGARYRIDSTA